MNNLTLIERRHDRDSWKDALFIIIAALLIALSIGAVTSKAAGKPFKHVWTLTVVDGVVEVSR